MSDSTWRLQAKADVRRANVVLLRELDNFSDKTLRDWRDGKISLDSDDVKILVRRIFDVRRARRKTVPAEDGTYPEPETGTREYVRHLRLVKD